MNFKQLFKVIIYQAFSNNYISFCDLKNQNKKMRVKITLIFTTQVSMQVKLTKQKNQTKGHG